MVKASTKVIVEDNIHWAYAKILKASSENFYGRMTVIFENGRVVRLIQETSQLPPIIEKNKI